MKTYLVDTNVILRFITREPETQAQQAAQFFQQCENGEALLKFSPIVIAEVVFVLTGKIYGFRRNVVAEQLQRFLSNPSFQVHDLDEILLALKLFKSHAIDFADAYLAASAQLSGETVASFDKDFRKIEGLDFQLISKTPVDS